MLEDTGCLLCRTNTSHRICRQPYNISKDNLKRDRRPIIYIGKYVIINIIKILTISCWLCSAPTNDSQLCDVCLENATANLPALKRRMNMFGKNKQESKAPSSNSVKRSSDAIVNEIGMTYGNQRRKETSWPCHHQSEFCTTERCGQSPATSLTPSPWNGRAVSFGASLVQERAIELGKKLALKRTPKIQERNFGTVIPGKKTWSLTNSEAVLTSPTCSDGWTSIQSALKSKDLLCHSQQQSFGSPPTSVLNSGIPISMPTPRKLFAEELLLQDSKIRSPIWDMEEPIW